MPRLRIRPGHVRPLWAGHPWVYAQAVAGVEGDPSSGDVVDVLDPQGKWLGAGFYTKGSAIVARIVTRQRDEAIDGALFRRRIAAALAMRRGLLRLPTEETTGYRLIHAEGDGLPGVIVDLYEQVAVMQLLTAGMKQRQRELCDAVLEVTGVRSVVESASAEHQEHEGFSVEPGVIAGEPVAALAFRELGVGYELPLPSAQKTGYYFDQRDNRARLGALCEGKRVLDAFCYLGGFALGAARGGAREVLAFDRSEPALSAARSAAERAGLSARVRFQRADAKRFLPELVVSGERFDVVVLDPPKLAPSTRHLPRARKLYRLWSSQALRLLSPGGVLLSCSCSAAMQPHDFVRTLALAAADTGRGATLFALGEQAPDHPTPPAFDEGRYLKAAFLCVG